MEVNANMVMHGLTCCDNEADDGMVMCYCGNCGYRDLGCPQCRIQLKKETQLLVNGQFAEIKKWMDEVRRLKKKAGEEDADGDGQHGICTEEDVGHKETDSVGSNIVAFPTVNRSVEE